MISQTRGDSGLAPHGARKAKGVPVIQRDASRNSAADRGEREDQLLEGNLQPELQRSRVAGERYFGMVERAVAGSQVIGYSRARISDRTDVVQISRNKLRVVEQ